MSSTPVNALVLGVGGNVSQGIQKALALSSVPTRVVAACISADAPGLYLADRAYISPPAADRDFIPWLHDVCARERIDVVLSGTEPVLEVLAQAAGLLREGTGATAVVSSPEILRIGADKLLTCRWLEAHGLPAPRCAELSDSSGVCELVAQCGFPLVAKPRFGKGSSAVMTVRDERQLGAVAATAEAIVGREVEMVVQEHLGNDVDEFTAGCFSDLDGNLRGTIVMRRKLDGGTTVSAELGEFPEMRAAAEAIVSKLGPLGPCNVQLRMDQGRAVPFEINPRFSGTTALRARLGFNEVDAALRHFVLGQPAPELRGARSGLVVRYWNEVYVPAETVDELRRDGSVSVPRAGVEVERWGMPK